MTRIEAVVGGGELSDHDSRAGALGDERISCGCYLAPVLHQLVWQAERRQLGRQLRVCYQPPGGGVRTVCVPPAAARAATSSAAAVGDIDGRSGRELLIPWRQVGFDGAVVVGAARVNHRVEEVVLPRRRMLLSVALAAPIAAARVSIAAMGAAAVRLASCIAHRCRLSTIRVTDVTIGAAAVDKLIADEMGRPVIERPREGERPRHHTQGLPRQRTALSQANRMRRMGSVGAPAVGFRGLYRSTGWGVTFQLSTSAKREQPHRQKV